MSCNNLLVHSNQFQCPACHTTFQSNCALSQHQYRSTYCNDFILSSHTPSTIQTTSTQKETETSSPDFLQPRHTTENVQDKMYATIPKQDVEMANEIDSIDDKQIPNFYHTSGIIHEVKLLKLLNDIGAPLYGYKAIMEWAQDAYMHKYDFDSSHSSYQQIIKYLEEDLQMKICRPQMIPVTLISDNQIFHVIVFDIKKMIASLLQDKEINKLQNLVVNSHDYFGKYEPIDNCYGEVNSGIWYQNAYKNSVKDPEKDFLCPIILSSDKTTLSDMGDLHVDAIFLTLSIFNEKVSL